MNNCAVGPNVHFFSVRIDTGGTSTTASFHDFASSARAETGTKSPNHLGRSGLALPSWRVPGSTVSNRAAYVDALPEGRGVAYQRSRRLSAFSGDRTERQISPACAAAALALGLAAEMAQAARQYRTHGSLTNIVAHTISIASLRSDLPSSCGRGED